jgi:hypothetical protein
MAAGLEITQASLNAKIGGTALTFLKLHNECAAAKVLTDRLTNAELIALDFTQPDIDTLKTAVNTMAAIMAAVTGGDLTFIRRIGGPGY